MYWNLTRENPTSESPTFALLNEPLKSKSQSLTYSPTTGATNHHFNQDPHTLCQNIFKFVLVALKIYDNKLCTTATQPSSQVKFQDNFGRQPIGTLVLENYTFTF